MAVDMSHAHTFFAYGYITPRSPIGKREVYRHQFKTESEDMADEARMARICILVPT